MPWELIAYWICFGLGTTYAAVSAILGGFFGMAHHGGDLGVGHADMGHDYGGQATGGHGEAFATGGGEVEPAIAPISPATISVFMATFGGAGILLTELGHQGVLVEPPSVRRRAGSSWRAWSSCSSTSSSPGCRPPAKPASPR